MKKITLNSAIDEVIGSAGAGAGVVAGSVLMKMAAGKVNPWLTPLVALVAGYGIRLVASNETLKDVGTGLLIAGTLDGAKKVLTKFSTVPGFTTINDSIPALSGGVAFSPVFMPSQLRDAYTPANVVGTAKLR